MTCSIRGSTPRPSLEKADRIWKRLHPELTHPNVTTTLNKLGVAYTYLGKPERAIPLLEEALALRKKDYEESKPFIDRQAIALTTYNLGLAHRMAGNFDAALSNLEQVVDLYRALAKRNRALEPALARSLDQLGTLFMETANHGKAMACFEQARKIREKLASDPHGNPLDLSGPLSRIGKDGVGSRNPAIMNRNRSAVGK